MPLIEREVKVMNSQGLHARPAALFVQIAVKYDSHVTVTKEGESVNGKSIMGILMLGAQKDSIVHIKAEGEDSEALVNELEEFLSKDE
ncbi:MAG: HPr family phosphocarrier protein [Candidatus Omnitrophica bacterium]|nr:HPr family phosphocarrier protein [Candidatus Omnitrophota bacterium]